MARVDTSKYQTFPQITERLDEIVSQVRDKDISLERSLDLFDEAIALGSKAVDMVDATDFSPEEAARLEEQAADKGEGAVAADGVAGDGEGADEQGDSSSKDTPAKENA